MGQRDLCLSQLKKDENNLIFNVMKARGRKEKERGRREVEMLKNLDSNFVIRLVDAFEGRSEVIHCASHILLIKESISVFISVDN